MVEWMQADAGFDDEVDKKHHTSSSLCNSEFELKMIFEKNLGWKGKLWCILYSNGPVNKRIVIIIDYRRL